MLACEFEEQTALQSKDWIWSSVEGKINIFFNSGVHMIEENLANSDPGRLKDNWTAIRTPF